MVTGVKKLGGTLGSVAAGGLKVFTAGVAAASAGVTVLGKKAVLPTMNSWLVESKRFLAQEA